MPRCEFCLGAICLLRAFERCAVFNEAIFAQIANFTGVVSAEEAEFWNAHFQQTSLFRQAHFFGTASFAIDRKLSAKFDGLADFTETEFDGGAYFDFVVFRSDAEFSRSRFFSVATFRKVTFGAGSNFWGVQVFEDFFSTVPILEELQTLATMKARACCFRWRQSLESGCFHSDVDFAFASLDGVGIFTGVVFENSG